jgi:ATP-dependent DNA ligase
MASSLPPTSRSSGFPRAAFRKQKAQNLCVWTFDLSELNGRDLHELPREKLKHSLQKLLNRYPDSRLRYSESFDDGEKLPARAEALGLEGIVSKRRDRPYRSVRRDWVKVKSAAWRDANKTATRQAQRSEEGATPATPQPALRAS